MNSTGKHLRRSTSQSASPSFSSVLLRPQAIEKLQTLQARAQLYSVAENLWQSLTPRERTVLGGDLQTAWYRHKSTIGIAAYLWKCSCLLYTSDAADERSSVDLG